MNNKILLKAAIILCTSLLPLLSHGQGIAINGTGSAADTSAMLDVSSTSKGLLVPRMLSSQRTTIGTPATGLLVYQTDAPSGFYQYNGTAWLSLGGDSTLAGGDLTGKYPNPTVAATASAGKHVVAAINADTDVINTANLGHGTATGSNYLRGDGTWSATSSKFVIPMGSGSSVLGLSTNSTGATDSVYLLGLGAAGNQLVNINGGTYIDVSNTNPMVAVTVPISGTITNFSFWFRYSNNNPLFLLTGIYTLQAQLYYAPPPSGGILGTDQFFPVTGGTISFNMSALSGGILVATEAFINNISGLSFPLAAGSRLLVLVSYNVSTAPFSVQPVTGYATASVGMQ